MKKKVLMAVILVVVIMASMITGAWAAANVEEISALLNRGITVEYNGVAQTFKDANGTVVYPITYNGSTYLPVRAISNLFNIPVDWDGNRNTVILGAGSNKDLTKSCAGGSDRNYVSSDPNEIGDHESCVVLTCENYLKTWNHDPSLVFLKGKGIYSSAYFADIAKFDIAGMKQVEFKMNSNAVGAEIVVYGAKSKVDSDEMPFANIATYTITENDVNKDVYKILNIDMSKYDTIMFVMDTWRNGKDMPKQCYTYIYDLTGIPN